MIMVGVMIPMVQLVFRREHQRSEGPSGSASVTQQVGMVPIVGG